MKVILLDNIKGVGKKDQVINASDGYARNYLFPKKLAVPADNGNITNLKSKQDSNKFRKDVEKQEAVKLAEELEKATIEIKVKAGDNGKIFGGVTAKEIAQHLQNQYKIEIDKKKIDLKDPIKVLGNFEVDIKLFEGVIGKAKLKVVSE